MSAGTYLQNFDSLGHASPQFWTNDQTLPGWYASRSHDPTDLSEYLSGDGSSVVGGLYSFGSGASTERALGALPSGTPGNLAFGVRFINDTAVARSDIVVAYTGEQWRVGGPSIQQLTFSFRVGSSLTNADARNLEMWNPAPILNFANPNTNSPQALDGNAATNRTALSNVLAGVVVGPGQELFLRWRDIDNPGFDDALAVDDLTVSFGRPITNPPPPFSTNGFSLVTYNLKGNFASDWTRTHRKCRPSRGNCVSSTPTSSR